jgi:hypothetical protein
MGSCAPSTRGFDLGLPSAATILWQPMQRSTDGTPAVLLRRAFA